MHKELIALDKMIMQTDVLFNDAARMEVAIVLADWANRVKEIECIKYLEKRKK